MPQAVWFFYASDGSDLPLAPTGRKGNGWFVSTIDAAGPRAMAWAPLMVPVFILNRLTTLRQLLWPIIRRDLAISFERLQVDMATWHKYEIVWQGDHSLFRVDGMPVLSTPMSPRGPLGFVSWMDNRRMTATPTGRLRWGTQRSRLQQWMEVYEIQLDRLV
jgi:hypothetical protein